MTNVLGDLLLCPKLGAWGIMWGHVGFYRDYIGIMVKKMEPVGAVEQVCKLQGARGVRGLSGLIQGFRAQVSKSKN